MRPRFEQQMAPGSVAIGDVSLSLKSRYILPRVFKALQYIFITPDLNEKVFALMERRISDGKSKTDAVGIDLWQILVLAVARFAAEANWYRLEHMANYDQLLRQMMGLPGEQYSGYGKQIEFDYQTLMDNVSLVDETLLKEVNELLANSGYQLLKKRKSRSL